MPRLILLVLVIGAVWWLIRSIRRQLSEPERRGKSQNNSKTGQQSEQLVACEQCGLHLPVSEATRLSQPSAQGDKTYYFCGREHQISWQQNHD